jgi:hypothetical protein
MAFETGLWTRILTTSDSPFVITPQTGITVGSIMATTGSTATIEGTKSVNSLPSEPIPLPENVPFAISINPGAFEGITIAIASGTVIIAAY